MGKRGETCLALDLGDRRRQARLTVEQLAERLECEPGHVWKMESRNASVTLPKMAKASKVLGPLSVHVEGEGIFWIVPQGNVIPLSSIPLVPAEAAWLEHKEVGEALEHLPRIQRAIMRNDRAELVHIARECIVEPKSAINELEAALNRYDPSIMQEAEHSAEMAAVAMTGEEEPHEVPEPYWQPAATASR